MHGFSNLGGALLSGVVLSKTANKESKRSTIAICYLTLAIFQIIALVIAKKGYIFLKVDNIIYLFLNECIAHEKGTIIFTIPILLQSAYFHIIPVQIVHILYCVNFSLLFIVFKSRCAAAIVVS